MVKHGNCKVICKTCSIGCSVKTNVNRNQQLEDSVITAECPHFDFSISILTNNSNFILNDEIQFKSYAKCKACSKRKCMISLCQGKNTKKESKTYGCHGHVTFHEYEFSSDDSFEIATQFMANLEKKALHFQLQNISKDLETYKIACEIVNQVFIVYKRIDTSGFYTPRDIPGVLFDMCHYICVIKSNDQYYYYHLQTSNGDSLGNILLESGDFSDYLRRNNMQEMAIPYSYIGETRKSIDTIRYFIENDIFFNNTTYNFIRHNSQHFVDYFLRFLGLYFLIYQRKVCLATNLNELNGVDFRRVGHPYF